MERIYREELYRQASELSAIAGQLIEAAASRDTRVLMSAIRNLEGARRTVEDIYKTQERTNPSYRPDYGRAYSHPFGSASESFKEFLRGQERRMHEAASAARMKPCRRCGNPTDKRDPVGGHPECGNCTAKRHRELDASSRLKEIAGYGPNDTKTPMSEVFRTAQRKAHPDAGGTAELFKEVTTLGIKLGVCDKTGKPVAS